MTTSRVLSVGQCGPDGFWVSHCLQRYCGAEVVEVSTFDEALSQLRQQRFQLVLVNRVTDCDGTSGLDLIQTLQSDPELATTPVMLVSNHANAQKRAVALGARPGFGKAKLNQTATLDKLRAVLASEPTV